MLTLGIDVGVVASKVVLGGSAEDVAGLRAKATARGAVEQALPDGTRVLVLGERRTRGRPLDVVRELLGAVGAWLDLRLVERAVCTGSAADLVVEALRIERGNPFQAAARGVAALDPRVRTVFEIGGESSRYLRLAADAGGERLTIADYNSNGDCAAGTGAFLDQQAGRLGVKVEAIAGIVAGAERCAQVAGRCSVFAKSDMIHAQQKGYEPAEVLKGLCRAVGVNFRSAVVKGHPVERPVMFIGGVARNAAIAAVLKETFGLTDEELVIPSVPGVVGALGAALLAAEQPADTTLGARLVDFVRDGAAVKQQFAALPKLSRGKVTLLRHLEQTVELTPEGTPRDAYLGIDIGSVGTKLALLDADGAVIHTIFTRTAGRPIQVVGRILRELDEAVGWAVKIRGVATTGSGRELIGELVGADTINDEITAHKTGASFVGRRLLGKQPDTIFEIGGQDSKYISLEPDGDGSAIVVDFTMNEACAAGTGSFLEERAEELGIAIKDEFAAEALRAEQPARLGERCTVFMERDVSAALQRGAAREDVIAGLAYSVGYNYINRVVRGRPIGQTVFFQGGTAFNDAVAAAFAEITGREIVVPPYNAVMGCIGAALLAREKMQATGAATRFRGYDIEQVDYTLQEFTCHGCGNRCAIQQFDVDGNKTHWGDKCSDRFRKQIKSERQPVIEDLAGLRTELLNRAVVTPPARPRGTIGIPLAMYTWDYLPLWRTFFHACGFATRLSAETNRATVRRGLEHTVAEPCFPIIVAHGHVAELLEQADVDHVFVPNMVSAQREDPQQHSFFCPWGMTLPFVARQSPGLRGEQGRVLAPTIRFDDGIEAVRTSLVALAVELGVERAAARRAFSRGLGAWQAFRETYQAAGARALEKLRSTGEPGMLLVGRSYNVFDGGASLAVAAKLRDLYGVNVIPVDALDLRQIDVRDLNENMYWSYGRRILRAARLVGQTPNLDIIYVTNFKCGPDSYLKSFIRTASGKPFLTLQFDGHSNDAGMLTRCEAYLDSKGILRWWRTRNQDAATISPDARSISPRCQTRSPA